MTDDRTLERAARAWIEVGPTRAPDQAVQAALLRIQTTPQERDWFPWRIPRMTTPLRLALLVGAAMLAIAGFGLLAGGDPGPGPAPTPSASPSASAGASLPAPAALPEILRGDWQAVTSARVQGGPEADEHIQLSLDWDGGEEAWIQRANGVLVLRSYSAIAPSGEIQLVSTEATAGCAFGDIGRYGWDRSDDGEFLELQLIEDACASRAAALARTWVHSLSAVTDGGPGVMPFTDRWLRATIPALRWGLGGTRDAADLRTLDDADPAITFLAIRNPMGLSEPCDAGRVPVEIDRTARAFVDYVQNDLPGLAATTVDTVVDGRPAIRLTVSSDDGVVDCILQSTGQVMAFHSMYPTVEGEWGLTPLGPHTMWIVEVDGDTFLLWYEGDGVSEADAQAVIDSVRFLDALPTP